MGYGARDLRPTKDRDDADRISNFLANAPRYGAMFMRPFARDFDDLKGFWSGALADGLNLRALSVAEGKAMTVFGYEEAAIEAMATEMLRRIKSLPVSGSGTHQLTGEKSSLDTYWRVLRASNRSVVADRQRRLMGTEVAGTPPTDIVTVAPATMADLKLIFAFNGDHAIDQWGFDPRRVTPQGHEAACRQAIESGRQLLGRAKGRPVFVAQLRQMDDETSLISRVFVPRPLRVRKKMVTSALCAATALALENAKEALIFADSDKERLSAAIERAGFEQRCPYRHIVTMAGR